jgi:hypothetical protein
MSSHRVLSAAVLVALTLVAGCGAKDAKTASTPSTAPVGLPSSASSSASGPPVAVNQADYQQALKLRACYENSFDAAEDPLGRDLPCDQTKAGFRLVGIQPAAKGDCPPNQVLVSEKQDGTDTVAPSLCLEPVTH